MESEQQTKCKCCGKKFDQAAILDRYPSIDEGVCGLMCDGSVADDFPDEY